MIDKIKTLLSRTESLEEQTKNYSQTQNNYNSHGNYLTFTKNLLNYSVLGTSKLKLAEIDVEAGRNIYLQNTIDLQIATEGSIKFSIIINNISVYKSTKSLNGGFNQITLLKNYTPLISGSFDIELEITSIDAKEIIISSETLTVWGICEIHNDIYYSAIELNDYYLITFNLENYIYYKTIPKQSESYNSEDFIAFKSALSHSFVYDNFSDKLLLFRVDLDGNLFYSDTDNFNEEFLMSDISHVSACASKNKIIVSIIKNGSCFYFEFKNGIQSAARKIDFFNNNLTKCLCFFNQLNEKTYIIMSDNKNSNYFLESTNEIFKSSDFISAKCSLEVILEGGK